jgi:hypothetical protein
VVLSLTEFKVQEFKEVLRAVPAVPDFPNHVVQRGILGLIRVCGKTRVGGRRVEEENEVYSPWKSG